MWNPTVKWKALHCRLHTRMAHWFKERSRFTLRPEKKSRMTSILSTFLGSEHIMKCCIFVQALFINGLTSWSFALLLKIHQVAAFYLPDPQWIPNDKQMIPQPLPPAYTVVFLCIQSVPVNTLDFLNACSVFLWIWHPNEKPCRSLQSMLPRGCQVRSETAGERGTI